MRLFFLILTFTAPMAWSLDYRSDSIAVRSILANNGISTSQVPVTSVSSVTNGRISHLNLSNRSLSSCLFSPAYAESLTALVHLDLSNNYITTLISGLHRFYGLDTLLLNNNVLITPPAGITALVNLRYADLSSNYLASISDISNLTKLEVLKAANNRITALPVGVWSLTSLHTLEVAGNPLGTLPSALGNLYNLVRLDVSNASLTALPSNIGACTALKNLLCSGNLLVALPDSLALITPSDSCDFGHNSICCASTEMEVWLDSYDPDWAATQDTSACQPCPPTTLQKADHTRRLALGEFSVYPNPISRSMTLRAEFPAGTALSRVRVMIHDASGRRVGLLNSTAEALSRGLDWTGPNLPKGIYTITMGYGATKLSKKILFSR